MCKEKKMDILSEAKKRQEELVSTRRYLHQHPEASMQEYETAEYVRRRLDEMGIPWLEAGKTGTVGMIEGNSPGRILGLRGDIDALEMTELNPCSYASKNPGLMHACGHDGHTAALLGAAAYLQEHRDRIPGKIKLIFQPGEENGQGARTVVESGAVKDVDGIFGLHVSNSLPIGEATIRKGVMSSANDKFRIWIKGRGCHGSAPQNGADALLAGASLVQSLQSVITRESDPLKPTVMTVGIFQSGTAFNILPEDAYIEGSIRVLEERQRAVNRNAIRRIAAATATAYKCQASVDFEITAKVVFNDHKMTDTAIRAASKILGAEAVKEQELSLGAEDFAEYLETAPVTYINIGSRNEEKGISSPHHHGTFDIDEDCLPICMAMYIQYAWEYFGIE
ncbi:amidohydrolase [Lactonifactor longoviformis]|uniref:Amidohydrolase n=2 Tax=Lactonifactor TaxID=420345 RepID=A0A1M4XMH1_9CLOT|nr:amidohydrolase [Lactonifactor longoviformis]SHE94689.1 amidohydrolase [Lactonifactor longoviformis DSM 17459]